MAKQLVCLISTAGKPKEQIVDEVMAAKNKFMKTRDKVIKEKREEMLKGKKYLVVYFEDDEMLGQMYTIKLERAGLAVQWEKHPTKDSITALGMIKPDLIIMDIIMPGMDGWETARRLRENEDTKDIPIFGLSNMGAKEDRKKSQELMDECWIRAEHSPQEVADKALKLIEK